MRNGKEIAKFAYAAIFLLFVTTTLSAADTSKSGAVTEQELLERMQKLEQRLAVLEALVGSGTGAKSPAVTAGGAAVPVQEPAWQASVTFDRMPTQFSTFRFEYNHRASNVPYFAGEGGVTPTGGNTGPAGSMVPGFTPDLLKYERRFTIALLVKL